MKQTFSFGFIAAALRLLAALLLWALLPAAQASTYAFRSDSYAWETTANTVTNWDKSCTGYQIDDDKVTLGFTGGFTFTFAGTAYTSVRVLSNGMLQFGADDGFHRTYTNTTLPAAAPGNYGSGCANAVPTNVLMGYWMDLKPSPATGGGGTVSWEQKGTAPNRYFVVSWNAVYQYNTTVPYTFQIILYENGEFKYQYGNANASGSNATIGVQVSATDYTLYSYKSGYNANGSAIRWFVASGAPSRLANYRFDEYAYTGGVGEVQDSTGNSHNGTAVGGAQTTASGYVCRALDVPANSSGSSVTAVDTAVSVPSLLGNDGSVSFWVRSNVVWSSNTPAMLFDASTAANRPFYLMRSGGGALKFAVADSNGNVLTATSTAQSFAANTWVHVAATWRLASGTNASVLRIYVNGVQTGVANGSTNGTVDPGIGTIFLGDVRGGFTPSGGTVNSANGAIDEVSIYNYEISAVELAADMAVSHGCVALHHVEIRGSASGLTCTPTTFTVAACQNSDCSVTYSGGVTGTLSASGTGMTVAWPDGNGFSIPAGSSTATVRMQLTTAGSVSVTASGLSPGASNAATCSFGSPACTFSAADTGLLFDVPDHYADAAQTVSIKAVKNGTPPTAGVCVPAFANVTKNLTFGCAYADPSNGTRPVVVGGASVACGSGTQGVALNFDATGAANTTVRYADVGRLSLTATYKGSGADAGLSMSATDSFTAAPASFSITAFSPSPATAGVPFTATVTALNSSNTPTPNFGKEGTAQAPAMGYSAMSPGAGSAGAFNAGALAAFNSGAAAWTGAYWPEVGTLTLRAQIANYLGSGLGASGTAPLRFVPKFLKTTMSVLDGGTTCSTTWAYAGRPFSATVTAYNGAATPVPTGNYSADLTLAPVVTPPTGESISGNSVTAANFANGSATATVTYAFSNKLTAPRALSLRAQDNDGIASNSPGGSESVLSVRSGRLRLFNAFGSEKSPLQMALQAEYWNGSAWLLNTDDTCTSVPATAAALSNVRSSTGAAAAWTTTATTSGTLAGGRGSLTLAAPPGGSTGSLDVAINLGSVAGADQACVGTHPSSTGAGVPWLRSQNGSCATTWDRDPGARASFGIYSPESRKTVHVREIF